MVYTFTLRADLKFADGSPITAQDVKDSWEYAARSGTGSLTVATYLGDIAGLLDRHQGRTKEIGGVQVQVQYLEPMNLTELARETPAHLVSYGWCADYPDPQNFLDVLFGAGSDFNVTHYDNPTVNDLLAQANTLFDSEERLRLYHQVEGLLLDDYVAIPLIRGESFVLVSKRLEGYRTAPVGVPIWDLVRLTP